MNLYGRHLMSCPIILGYGSGARLWSLSRKSFPKQFIPLMGEKPLLRLALRRVVPLRLTGRVINSAYGARATRSNKSSKF